MQSDRQTEPETLVIEKSQKQSGMRGRSCCLSSTLNRYRYMQKRLNVRIMIVVKTVDMIHLQYRDNNVNSRKSMRVYVRISVCVHMRCMSLFKTRTGVQYLSVTASFVTHRSNKSCIVSHENRLCHSVKHAHYTHNLCRQKVSLKQRRGLPI